MSQDILAEIKKIEAEAAARIQALKEKAASGIAKALAEAKDRLKEAQKEVDRLAAEYAAATGKTIKGEKVEGRKTRVRLSADDKAKLAEQVKETLKSANGAKLKDLREAHPGFSDTNLREAIKSIKGIKTTGNRASMVYFVK